MSDRTLINTPELIRLANEEARRKFDSIPELTAEERAQGQRMLSDYVELMAETGERDPTKIAKMALGLVREFEQITRSKASINCREAVPG